MFRGVKREPNSFHYKSRFYDAEKEEKEKRRKSLELELKEEENRNISFKRGKREDWIKQTYKKQAYTSNVIFIVILLILCLIALGVINYLDSVHV